MTKGLVKTIAAAMLLGLPALLSAEKILYISPNNDGVQDELSVPLKIKDRGLITFWQLVIKDANGTVVRTIGNKVALPSHLTFKQFFKQLVTPKSGVDIPEKVIWNGALDNGEYAPDGTYTYHLEASDINGNKGTTPEYTVVVDTVAPEVTLTQPSDKIFGEGAKLDFKVQQSGSKEDKWTGTFKDTAGKVVRTFTWTNASPAEFKWTGSDDAGMIVADGVYSYEIAAKDRAGNVSSPASITNIIYSAEKPTLDISLSGPKYLSPGTDSKLSSIELLVQIPLPPANSGNKLTAWKVAVTGEDGTEFRAYGQGATGNPPTSIVFDGRDGKGAVLPQGRYRAVVSAAYMNGYEPEKVSSPEFIVDTVKPSAKIAAAEKEFGGAAKPVQTISIAAASTPKLAEVTAWKGRIFNTADPSKPVKEFDFGQDLPESVQWNGSDSSGKLLPNGSYRFEVVAEDLAGNTGVSSGDAFSFNTADAKVILSVSEQAFSPDGNGVKDSVTFTPQLVDAGDLAEYVFQVNDSSGKAVYSVKSAGKMPASFPWNGKTDGGTVAPEGKYTGQLQITTVSGSHAEAQTGPFILDVTPPTVKASVSASLFSPDGDGVQDSVSVKTENCSSETQWKAEVKDASGKTVKKYTWKGVIPKSGFDWDGSTDSGSKAKDGVYGIVLSSEDAAGNKFSTTLPNLTLDSRETKAFVTAEHDGIAPNGDKSRAAQTFTVRATVTDGIGDWKFEVRNEKGAAIRSWTGKDTSALPATFVWDGKDSAGKAAEGTFIGALQINYKKGNKVNAISSPFYSTALPPQLTVQTTPQYFSPDNDGTDDELFIRLKGETKALISSWSFVIDDPRGNTFWKTGGKGSITERIIWAVFCTVHKDKHGRAERVQSAMDYPYTFTVTDSLGMTSVKKGIIAIDILVIRDGNLLKMAVPSIIFRSDAADFKTEAEIKNGLKAEVAAKNEAVLNRIAEVLRKFKDYKVTVLGHANRITDNPAEETENNPNLWGPALIPLSKERADYVKDYLIKQGVGAARLATDGKGGTELLVDYTDKANNWKNRRVEFILNK